MKLRSPIVTVLATLLGVTVPGCSAQQPTTPPPELRFVVAGASVTAGAYDFGSVERGGTASLSIVVVNGGGADLVLSGFEAVSGDAVTATPGVTSGAPLFRLALDGDSTLAPGETKELLATYQPPRDAPGGRAYEAQLRLLHVGGPGDSGRFTLRGTVSSLDCAPPARLDFGGVTLGLQERLAITLRNPSASVPRTIQLGAPRSPQGESLFTLTPDLPAGEVTLQPGETRDVMVAFAPLLVGDFTGELPLKLHEACEEQLVPLVGSGVEWTPWWTPTLVDFAFVPPGSSVEREVTFFNASTRELTVTDLSCFEGNGPSARYAIVSGATTLTLPAATRDASDALVPGQVSLRLRFSADSLGVRPGTLRGSVDGRQLAVALRAICGGPDIAVSPANLDVGRVAFFAGANPLAYAERRLSVQNVGPAAFDNRGNLKLGSVDAMGTPHKPYWEVRAMNGNSSTDELCVGAFDTATQTCLGDLDAADYTPTLGVVAGGALALPVRVMPRSTGLKAWQVQLFSNDFDEPVSLLTVTAEAVLLPPCSVSISPAGLQFGVVTPGRPRTQRFRVSNLGTQPSEVCLIDNLALAPETGRPPGAPPVFSLPAVAAGPYELGPGQSLDVDVVAAPDGLWPGGPTPVAGSLGLSVSNPQVSRPNLALAADVGRSCLVVMPEAWDFATSQLQCGAASRPVSVYNDCPSPVTLQQLLLEERSLPAGSPGCPGPQPCPEFSITGAPTQPVTLGPGASFTSAQLGYRPLDVGADDAQLHVVSVENGRQLESRVLLAGRGASSSANVDRFTLPRKADALLVLDDSGSGLLDVYEPFATRYADFFQYANQQQVDYQLGVTTTDPTQLGVMGGRLHLANGVRLLTPSTPRPEEVFRNLIVGVGINGSGTEMALEPAVAAVSWPLIVDASANRGLVRPNASLNIIVMTNASDQSTRPSWLLHELLRQVKGTQQPGLLSYSVMGPFLPAVPAGCGYDGSGDWNDRHANASEALHGITEEICAPESMYAGIAQRLGAIATGRRDHFFLKTWPDPVSPMEVLVDGRVLPVSAWTYEVLSNAVVVSPNYLPTPGQTVEVRYQAVCVP